MNASGWLFWAVDMWWNEHYPIPTVQLSPLVTRAGSTLFTDFSPKMFNGAADHFDRHAFSNGDGIVIYPGRGGKP